MTPEVKELALGAEVAMWTETVNTRVVHFLLFHSAYIFPFLIKVSDGSVEARVFPRASALGERLWSNPQPGDWVAAEHR